MPWKCLDNQSPSIVFAENPTVWRKGTQDKLLINICWEKMKENLLTHLILTTPYFLSHLQRRKLNFRDLTKLRLPVPTGVWPQWFIRSKYACVGVGGL